MIIEVTINRGRHGGRSQKYRYYCQPFAEVKGKSLWYKKEDDILP